MSIYKKRLVIKQRYNSSFSFTSNTSLDRYWQNFTSFLSFLEMFITLSLSEEARIIDLYGTEEHRYKRERKWWMRRVYSSIETLSMFVT